GMTGMGTASGGVTGMGTARLRVYAWLRQQRPDLAARDVELGSIDSVQGLLDAVHLAAPEGAIILLNDRRAESNSPVREGDVVSVFPMLEGG
ncbi:MAG: MoaD/ThiS family protein, partial [Spirochaetes bacterium]|nr:MoaD/ThiS family protein [Spirochaetota bacterium]